MDIPSLRGIARTAPSFSNHTAATLEEIPEHYQQFFKRVQAQNPAAPLLTTRLGVAPPVIDRPFADDETAALLAYLRRLSCGRRDRDMFSRRAPRLAPAGTTWACRTACNP